MGMTSAALVCPPARTAGPPTNVDRRMPPHIRRFDFYYAHEILGRESQHPCDHSFDRARDITHSITARFMSLATGGVLMPSELSNFMTVRNPPGCA